MAYPRVSSAYNSESRCCQSTPNGIREAVLAFVAQQPGEVQDAFEYSGSFVRADQMMQAGFAAMGFTEEQQDQFWKEASKL